VLLLGYLLLSHIRRSSKRLGFGCLLRLVLVLVLRLGLGWRLGAERGGALVEGRIVKVDIAALADDAVRGAEVTLGEEHGIVQRETSVRAWQRRSLLIK